MPQTTIYLAPRPSAAPPPAVETVELAHLFGRSPALAGISLRVDAGRTIALLGPNGAGKTTLLRILAGTLRPSFGTARILGLDVAAGDAALRRRVAYLPHANGLYPDLTGAENLSFAAAMLGQTGRVAREGVATALSEAELSAAADQRVQAYSAGMRRRLALARLLLHDASLVLLDEPHAALDAEGMALVDRLVTRWRAEERTVLIASHQAERVLARADGWARLDGGLLVEVGGAGVTAGDGARRALAPAPSAVKP
jgi:heme exporter protein A